jgi:hypothetical protein
VRVVASFLKSSEIVIDEIGRVGMVMRWETVRVETFATIDTEEKLFDGPRRGADSADIDTTEVEAICRVQKILISWKLVRRVWER